MSNHFFQFKQFKVQQDQCAMKVCTDACLFGAWVSDLVIKQSFTSILDIGTGTGLLSLMLAQKTTAAIDAVEIEAQAFLQAGDNFRHSPWTDRLQVIHTDIRLYNSGRQYDLIISNPPFFENDLRSVTENKNAAKHDSTLTLDKLIATAKELLQPAGLFAVLLPYHRSSYFTGMALEQGLYCYRRVHVKQTPRHDYFRTMLLFGFDKQATKDSTLTIKEHDGNYSGDFISLLREYYLYL